MARKAADAASQALVNVVPLFLIPGIANEARVNVRPFAGARVVGIRPLQDLLLVHMGTGVQIGLAFIPHTSNYPRAFDAATLIGIARLRPTRGDVSGAGEPGKSLREDRECRPPEPIQQRTRF